MAKDAYPMDKATLALYLLAFCLAEGICDRKASEGVVRYHKYIPRQT